MSIIEVWKPLKRGGKTLILLPAPEPSEGIEGSGLAFANLDISEFSKKFRNVGGCLKGVCPLQG